MAVRPGAVRPGCAGWLRGGLDRTVARPRCWAGKVASLDGLTGLLRGLPFLLAAAPACADVVGDGPVRGGDLPGLFGGDGGAVGVAELVGACAQHRGVPAEREVGGDDAEC